MSPEQSEGPAQSGAAQHTRSRFRRALRWVKFSAGLVAVYAVVGWAIVRYGPREHTVLHTPSGDVELLGAKPFLESGRRRLQLYVADPDETADERRAAAILESVVPDRPSDDLRSIGISFVRFHGIWPVTFTSSNGFVFARSPQGGWSRADRDQLRDHLTALKP